MPRIEPGRRGVAGWLLAGLLFLLSMLASLPAAAGEAAPAVENPALEARVMKLSAELRCLVCQNQTIADSNAELAVDLRNQVREMLRRGESDDQVRDYMTERYGDFVLYRPPLKSTTAFLWFGPALLLVGGVGVLLTILWRRQRMSPDRFEPDADDADDDAGILATPADPAKPAPDARPSARPAAAE